MKKLVLVIGLVTGIFVLTNAQAQEVVRQRQQNQIQRINEGVNNGELTRAETKRLRAEQKHIRQEKRMAKADGVITRNERRHIKRSQRKANRDIHRQKNDLQTKK